MKFRVLFAKVTWDKASPGDWTEEDFELSLDELPADLEIYLQEKLEKKYPDADEIGIDDFWPLDREAYVLWRKEGLPGLPEFEDGN